MVDIIIIFIILIVAIACLMEATKELIEAVCKALDIPAIVWRLIATVYSALGSYLTQTVILQSEELITPLLTVLLNRYMLFAIIPIVWWLQLQLDMKVIKEYFVPFIKKYIAKKFKED